MLSEDLFVIYSNLFAQNDIMKKGTGITNRNISFFENIDSSVYLAQWCTS